MIFKKEIIKLSQNIYKNIYLPKICSVIKHWNLPRMLSTLTFSICCCTNSSCQRINTQRSKRHKGWEERNKIRSIPNQYEVGTNPEKIHKRCTPLDLEETLHLHWKENVKQEALKSNWKFWEKTVWWVYNSVNTVNANDLYSSQRLKWWISHYTCFTIRREGEKMCIKTWGSTAGQGHDPERHRYQLGVGPRVGGSWANQTLR